MTELSKKTRQGLARTLEVAETQALTNLIKRETKLRKNTGLLPLSNGDKKCLT
jgi:hypothetical protein